MIDNKSVIGFYIKRLDKSKWDILFRSNDGIQIKKLRQINKLGICTGLFLLPFWGIGFIVWLLTLLDYWLQHEKIMFISIDDMVKQIKEIK